MEEQQSKNLILICEGGAHTVEYFHKNKVFPSKVVFEAVKFQEMAPYLSKDDDVLLLVKGLTDFSLSEVYALLKELEKAKDKLHNITIMSNINLGKISTPYYLYSGDLFYGTVKEVINAKVFDIVNPNEQQSISGQKLKVKKKDKSNQLAQNTTDTRSINGVISRYKLYSKRDIVLTIYGSEKKQVEPKYELDSIISKIVNVELFPNN